MRGFFSKVIENFTSLTLVSSEKIDSGVMTDKYLIKAQNNINQEEKFIIRIYPNQRSNVEKYEPDVLKKLNESGVKTPEYIGSSREFEYQEYKYIIYRYLPGRQLSEVYEALSKDQRATLISQIVKNLFKLSQIECVGYGPLVNNFDANYDSWQSFLLDAYHQGIDPLKSTNKFNPKKLDEFHKAFPNPVSKIHSKTNLVWLDFHPDNIIVDDSNQLAGFIDFEELVSGDPIMSLGYLYARIGSCELFNMVKTEFTLKYGEFDQNRIEEYSFLRVLRIAPYLKQNLPTGKERDELFHVFKGIAELNCSSELPLENGTALHRAFKINEDINAGSGNEQRIRAATTLIFFSVAMVSLFIVIFLTHLNDRKVTKVPWDNSEDIPLLLSETPIWFNYANDTLYTDIIITDANKKELIHLLPDSLSSDVGLVKAINNLAFKSRGTEQNTIYLILACGIISVIGVMIRSLWDFVGNASYKDEISINRWWPWYVLRPFIGFMGGVVFFFLYSGGILDINVISLPKSKIYLLLGFATIVGFGLNDFVIRLRLISKAAFGGNSN